MVNTIYSVNDGAQITVSELLGMPKAIAKPLVDYLTEWDLASALFRNAGPNNGSVLYEKDAAPFTADGLETVAEFAEIPTTRGVSGDKVVAIAEKEARALEVSYEMRDENQVAQVNRLIRHLRNSAMLSSTRRVKAVLEGSDIPSEAASAAWSDAGADIIDDVNRAVESIADAEVPGYEGNEEAVFDFEPDTIIVPRSMLGAFSKNEDVRSVWVGNIADQNPLYKGFIGQQFMGLNIVVPKFWYKDRILVTSSDEIGFTSDTRALGMAGPFDKPDNEVTRYQLSRKRIIAVDSPSAGCWITGVKA